MEKSLNHADFWLPPQFPNEFPYEFETFSSSTTTNSTLDSPVESVISSNETQTTDEDDFFAALTQRLSQNLTYNKSEKKVVISGSPQSTLSGFGSPNNGQSQAPSPPTTPFGVENNTWDLIYAAAGQVARLKINGDGLMGLPQTSNLFPSFQNPTLGFYSQSSQFQYGTRCVQNQQIQRREGAWPTLQTHRRSESPAILPVPVFHGGGSAPRKECVGTGVFLPRRYDNPPQSCKRSDSRPVSMIQGKVVHGRNPSMEGLNRSAPQTTSNHRLAPSYEALIAKRNAIFAQQRLNHHRSTEGVKSHELLLPQEWTY